MYRNVLGTWRRILDGEDTMREFEQGEERVKNYLLKLKEPELVEDFGCWLAARNTQLGIQVFAAEEAKVKFDPSKVLEMFREHAPNAVRPYVEYLVVEKKAIPLPSLPQQHLTLNRTPPMQMNSSFSTSTT